MNKTIDNIFDCYIEIKEKQKEGTYSVLNFAVKDNDLYLLNTNSKKYEIYKKQFTEEIK